MGVLQPCWNLQPSNKIEWGVSAVLKCAWRKQKLSVIHFYFYVSAFLEWKGEKCLIFYTEACKTCIFNKSLEGLTLCYNN